MNHLRYLSFSILGLWLFLLPSLVGQQLSISGVVRDPDTVASGITVILRSPSGTTQKVDTDASGQYRFDNLATGAYELSFTGRGFETTTRTLTLSKESRTADVTLSVSGVSTTLEVVDSAEKATASRMEIPDIEIPAQVSTIPREVLEQQGANDMVTALRNASGITAQRFYGVYEYYTIRGLYGQNVMLVDGMRISGNRINTQLNNVEEVQILKGPSSILYGSGALGGSINVIRKQPQGQRTYDLFYRGGRFNDHQVGGGAAGPLITNKLLYRVDASFNHSDGWRGAGGDRFNISPAITWLINDRNRLTVYESFNHDNFNGDGGLPVGVLSIPNFDLSRRFSTPWDFEHSRDLQTNVVFNSIITSSWEFRDSFLHRRANDEYFVTEYPSLDPDFPAVYEVDRYALYFFHHWRPIQNQADIIGRFRFLGTQHSILTGYEYEYVPDRYTTTADGGDHFLTNRSLITFQETNPPVTSFPTARLGHFNNRTNAVYWQDQMSLTEHLKLNVGGRYDMYHRTTQNNFFDDSGALTTIGATTVYDQNAYTYRGGLVYELPKSMQVYFSSSSSFNPVNIIPLSGPSLIPETGRLYEFGHRWQSQNRHCTTNLAFYKIERQNVVVALGMNRYDQAAQESSRGIDFDVKGDLGLGIYLIANYGYASVKYDSYGDFTGNRPKYSPAHTGNVWLTKGWKSGFTASVGMQYRSGMYTEDDDSYRLGGWTVFSGAVSYKRKNWEYSVNAENLFNRQRYFFGADYEDLVYPGAPINVFATIRYRFQ